MLVGDVGDVEQEHWLAIVQQGGACIYSALHDGRCQRFYDHVSVRVDAIHSHREQVPARKAEHHHRRLFFCQLSITKAQDIAQHQARHALAAECDERGVASMSEIERLGRCVDDFFHIALRDGKALLLDFNRKAGDNAERQWDLQGEERAYTRCAGDGDASTDLLKIVAHNIETNAAP